MRFVARFPRPQNIEIQKGAGKTQLWIALVVVLVLILIAAFVLVRILAPGG